MKAYFSALVDKSVPQENLKLAKNLIRDLKKSLKTSKSTINIKEHNTFIFLSVDKPREKPFDSKIIPEIQKKIHLRLEKYYIKNPADICAGYSICCKCKNV